MMDHTFLAPLESLAEYTAMRDKIKTWDNGERESFLLGGCIQSQKVHLMAALFEGCSFSAIIVPDEDEARELFEEHRMYDPDVMLFPAKDAIFHRADIRSHLLDRQQMVVLKELCERKKACVILSEDAAVEPLLSREELKSRILNFEPGQELDLDQLQYCLVSRGYERVAQVEAAGQFSIRGGILDIFPITDEVPVRIEFWGDEIDSIRTFDMETQRSTDEAGQVTVYPVYDERVDAGHEDPENTQRDPAGGILQYFDRRYSVVCRDEFKGMTFGTQSCFMKNLPGQIPIEESYHVTVQALAAYHNSFTMLVSDLKKWKTKGYSVALICASRTRAQRLARDLTDYELSSFYSEDPKREVRPGEILVRYGHAKKGFEYPMLKFVVITESDIFGYVKKKRRKKKSYSGQKIASFNELSVGDYVVHERHGLGIYRGIEQVESGGVSKDFMKIEYAGSGKLYIPATQLDALQKYGSSDGAKPKINRLGGSEWERTKNKVRTAVEEIAKDLVELYAVRQQSEGYCYGKDTVWQKEFEELFPFDETEDQLAAIEDTKRDMESSKIMDRLICGDVGYGKTEIALRAAFKAVQEHKQVVLLVPTTILAQQHYNTFTQRLKDYPVRVDMLSRFRSGKQQEKTIADLQKGLVDILIGTHRVLSEDVCFHDLGLLVIDEEQRFGVRHKDKIKKLRANVDVLTLSATPIPRTLHMSLIGIRDMSVLEEPPQDRVPIQTYVMEYDDTMVREALRRELKRGGQVYYVFNRVIDIANMARRVQELVPDAQVAFAHGRMPEHQLERIMYDFIAGDIDILISTTIIETGLDISNVNTIIIHDADKMGLSQLYQLRGRVGRSNRTAYAFLLYRRDKMVTEVAQKRLGAIREFTELGSGIKIAMRDLEIRGAGNILGKSQHGHMEAVGYDLYCKMLSEAVQRMRGIEVQEDFETSIDLSMDAFIPDTYIANEYQKLDTYKRIAGIDTENEYEQMQDELMDRFGEPPAPVRHLLLAALIKALSHAAYITDVRQKGSRIELLVKPDAGLDVKKLPDVIVKYADHVSFRPTPKPLFTFDCCDQEEETLRILKQFLLELA